MLLEKEDEQTVLVTLYVMIDDLLKAFQTRFGRRLRLPGKSPRGRKTLSLAEWITLGLFRYALKMDDVKVYHRHILSHYSQDFKSLPNYQNFNAQLNRATPYVIFLLQWLCHLQRKAAVLPYLIDSTALPVCENTRIASHKVCEGFAGRGKTTTGWFYGFKLQTVCDSLARLISVLIVPGNTDDRKFIFKLFQDLKGLAIGDAGFVSRPIMQKLSNQGLLFITDVKKNMKRLMSPMQHWLLKQRQRIEISYSVLTYRLQQATSVARSVLGYFSRWLYACLSYTVFQLLENSSQGLL